MEKVTIGIPSYNSGKYIRNCIESVMKQTYSNLEIIVVDNGSQDNTEEIVLSFKDPRIKFIRNPENIYCYGSTNVIMNIAETEFVAVYHSDDMYKPTVVEEQVRFLQQHKNVMAVFTEANLINSSGTIIGEWKIPKEFESADTIDFRTAFNGFLKYGDFFICPSAMFVKKVFSEIGTFKEEKFFSTTQAPFWLQLLERYEMDRNMIFTANDLEMWLRMLQKFQIGILHKKLMCYRIHAGQGTASHSTSYENFFIVMDYYEKYARENNLISQHCWNSYRSKKIRWEFSKGQRALGNKEFVKARKNFIRFLKSFHKIFPDITFKDFYRFLWAVAVISSGPFICNFRTILNHYLIYKNRHRQKKMRLP